jgi:hypothetical protein
MGTWNSAPWDCDEAADWFGDLFDATDLARRVEETLALEVEDHHREIRAAASLLIFLGRTYVWPIGDVDRHLQLAASKLEEMAALPEASELMDVDRIRAEAAFLRARLEKPDASAEAELAATWAALR